MSLVPLGECGHLNSAFCCQLFATHAVSGGCVGGGGDEASSCLSDAREVDIAGKAPSLRSGTRRLSPPTPQEYTSAFADAALLAT